MKADLFKELGRTGLNYQGGNVYEELLPELSGYRWRRAVRQMIDNDAGAGRGIAGAASR